MPTLAADIPLAVRQRFRELAESAEDVAWPACMAADYGWREANQAYQAQQRALGAAEMRALVATLGLSPPFDADQRRDLLLTAVDLFLHTAQTRAEVRSTEGSIDVKVFDCPLVMRFMDPRWHGLSACGCFARRKGWYEALNAPIEEELMLCRKWGDEVCELTIRVG